MGPFTFIPTWTIEDLVIYVAAAAVVAYIVKREAQPVARLMEMVAFVALDCAVFENFATVIHLYAYGRSGIMFFNVPLSIPLFEYLLIYVGLRFFEKMQMPIWLKPLGVGFLGVIADFTLDPVSVKQTYDTIEGTVARWQWFVEPGYAQIYGEPVSNFTGWMTMLAIGSAFILMGRAFHRRSGYRPVVGYVYPFVAAIASLVITVSPINPFALGLRPFFPAGSSAEWVMLGLSLVVPPALFALLWRGRMVEGYTLRSELALFAVLAVPPMVSLLFTIIGGHWEILWLEIVFTIAMFAITAVLVWAGKRAEVPPPTSARVEPTENTRDEAAVKS